MAELSAGGQQVCDEVLALVRERMPGERGEAMTGFITQYLAGISDEDLVQFRTGDLYGAAVAHWNFLHVRLPGTTRIRVYNPRHDDHGWQSTHTIVEVACDDMPFLVDSVRMAMDRLELTVHLLIHPVMHIRRSGDGHALEAVTRNQVHCRFGEFRALDVMIDDFWHNLGPSFQVWLDQDQYTCIIPISWFK